MITAPLSCAVTTVFRLMATTKIIMARRITVSLRDIVSASEGCEQPGRYSINKYNNVKRPEGQACARLGTGYLARGFRPRLAFRPVAQYRYLHRLGAASLYEQQYGGTK